MHRLLCLLACVCLGFVLGGCRGGECVSSENCPTGTVCSAAGACVALSCTSSDACPIGTHCDLAAGGCRTGCVSDVDCKPSERCDATSGECALRRCRNSRLDCALGEICEQTTGRCLEGPNYFCDECTRDSDCGAPANLCLGYPGVDRAYCGISCDIGADYCPGGSACQRVTSLGETVGYQCVAACWEEGFTPEFPQPVFEPTEDALQAPALAL